MLLTITHRLSRSIDLETWSWRQLPDLLPLAGIDCPGTPPAVFHRPMQGERHGTLEAKVCRKLAIASRYGQRTGKTIKGRGIELRAACRSSEISARSDSARRRVENHMAQAARQRSPKTERHLNIAHFYHLVADRV